MNKLILVFFLTVLNTQASYETEIVTRDKDMKMVIKNVTFNVLDGLGTLETPAFKIVLGKNNTALKLSLLNQEMKLRASSVFYHLQKARNFFLDTVKSSYVSSLSQVIIRLEFTNQFNSIGHFASDYMEPKYNNALTIPAGIARPKYGVSSWEREIWFRPKKNIKMPKSVLQSDFDQVAGIFQEFRDQTRTSNLQRFISELFSLGNDEYFGDNLLRTVGSTALVELSYVGMKTIYGIFQPTKFFLDSAMIPEIVYHEYVHVALSDYLQLSHSSPVNEGMADYFAAAIANSSEISHNVKKYAKKVRSKDAFRDELYSTQYETNAYANIDFVLGILWKIRDIDESSANMLVYNLRKKLNSSSVIRVNLVQEILKACKKLCPSPFVNRLELLKSYHEMGL